VIVGIPHREGGTCAGMILCSAGEIDGIVNRLDQGCPESAKIREFFRKHYTGEQN
jgi:hypothetical protein